MPFFLSFFLSFFLFFFSISLTFLSVNIKRFIGVSNENIHDLNPLTPIIDFIFSFKKNKKMETNNETIYLLLLKVCKLIRSNLSSFLEYERYYLIDITDNPGMKLNS